MGKVKGGPLPNPLPGGEGITIRTVFVGESGEVCSAGGVGLVFGGGWILLATRGQVFSLRLRRLGFVGMGMPIDDLRR
jgi:hypothetical protein